MENTIQPRTTKRRGSFGKYIFLVFFLLLAGLALFVWWNYYYTYSDGNRSGLLQKFSRRGNLFKTYEGELILSSVRGNQNVPIASEKFFFTVTDENVAKKLNDLQGGGVTVHYQEKKSSAFWRGDSPYIVDSVRAEPQPKN
jgi:hypothetical protein